MAEETKQPEESGELSRKALDKIIQHYKTKTLLEHLVGPTGSVIFHILLVIVAVRFMVFEQKEKPADIQVMLITPDAKDLEEFDKELEKLENLENIETDVPQDVQIDVDAPVTENVAPTEDVTTDLNALNVLADVQSPLVMKGLLAGRSSGGRAMALGAYGGKYGKMTEEAVIKALEWLKRNQAADGSWGPNKEAMTGLGLLTFLAHGETTASEKYGPTVEKAIRFLVSKQKEGGEFVEVNQPGSYAHAIATYAISEAYGLTRIPNLKTAMEKAAGVIVRGQQAGGLWDYFYKKEARWDTSVAGWQIQALKAAYIAGADVPGLKEAMEKSVIGLENAQSPETGRFGYSSRGAGSDGVTAVGTLCLQLLGKSKNQSVKMGLNAMNGFSCDWQQPPAWPMYAWYYITQAKFHSGGQDWTLWNSKFAPEIAKNQNEDGSWTSAGANLKEGGHGQETNLGPVYSTTLAALTLQVYYRFLPTYKPIEHEEEKKTTDDVSVEII